MVRLLNLEPQWLCLTGEPGHFDAGVSRWFAQGLMFLCPLCYVKNGGPIGTHSVICWSRTHGVPDSEKPGPGRWMWQGKDFSDLTIIGDPPGNARSIDLSVSPGGCGWHGFITNGEAT